MNLKISAILFGAVLAAFGMLSPDSQPNPVEADRLNNLGCAYMNQQLFEKGLKHFQEAAAADPKLTIARINEGIAYLSLQKLDLAKTALNDALKQEPKNPYVWYNLGLLAKNTGDSEAAIEDFKHVTDIDAKDADGWYFLGTAYVQSKQFPQAIDAFHHALEINPIHASAEFGLSRAYQQSGQTEMAREQLKHFQYITQNKIASPMSLAYGEQGQYSRAIESPQEQLKPPPQIQVRFVDVTKEAGLVAATPIGQAQFFHGPGACFLDYDNDGLIDLLLTDYGSQGGIALYHNLGHGKFEDVTLKAGLDPRLHAIACTAGDYDNDGYADVVVSLMGRVVLLHNEKNGTFKDASERLPVRPNGSVRMPAWIDYDHDGDIDLFLGSSALGNYNGSPVSDELWRNNGDGTFTDVSEEKGVASGGRHWTALGTDYNNDRAVDILVPGIDPVMLENPREGKFIVRQPWDKHSMQGNTGVAVADFDHDGWMDLATAHFAQGVPALSLWHNDHGASFHSIPLPTTDLNVAYGVAAFDYDNDGWVDLVAVGETKDGKGEIKLFRNLGPDGFKDVTSDVGLDKIHLEHPRAIITGDYDNDGATDLLITQNHGPAVLLRNEGGNQNHWLRLALKGLNDNKSAIGTKVEVFSGGNRQKFEIYGSNGYLGQNSPYLTVGLGQSTEADIVRMVWPTGVLQDEIHVAGDKQQNFLELDRRGSSCPTLFAWNGKRYEFVADMLGAGVVGHWIGPNQRDIPRPVEWIKIDRDQIQEKSGSHVSQMQRDIGHPRQLKSSQDGDAPVLADVARTGNDEADDRREANHGLLSFRFMEPLEEAVYLDQVRLLAVDHPANVDVYPNEYFASNPPYPPFKVVVSKDAKLPAGAWDGRGHSVLPNLQAHRYFGDFKLTQFQGFAEPHTLTLDLGEPYRGGPLWLLLHGEVEYFSANSMYAASQAGIHAIPPYVEALMPNGKWKRVEDDMGFPAGGPRTMTADLTGKLPIGTRKIRFTTNLQVYWDSILVDRTQQPQGVGHPERSRLSGGAKDLASSGSQVRLTPIPLVHADLEFHGYPLKIEGQPAGNVDYIYEETSATGPYTRPAGNYTRYGDVLPLLTKADDKLAVFGSGDEVRIDFDPSHLPAIPPGWVRDYFFAANGYEKDMDFYAAEGSYVAPLPFLSMGGYPYTRPQAFPMDDAHVKYLLKYNTRSMSGDEQRGYAFDYPKK